VSCRNWKKKWGEKGVKETSLREERVVVPPNHRQLLAAETLKPEKREPTQKKRESLCIKQIEHLAK